MKKIILIIVIMLVTGCVSDYRVKLDDDLISNIIIENKPIVKEDYEYLEKTISKLSFKKDKNYKVKKNGRQIKIVCDEIVYKYLITDKYIYLEYDNLKLISNNIKEVDKINKLINDLFTKYNDSNYFNINYKDKLNDESSSYLNINIDNNTNYISILSNLSLRNFKITLINEKKEPIEELYNKEYISRNTIINIKKTLTNKKELVLSWYNYYHKQEKILIYLENNEIKKELLN